uniref:Uncharacterized protein n=1 Tax=Aplanochytrium stocchinoi TaxID=215587 RepID=A0A7S3PQ58_9STRA|mmetsp:Transcript_1937/g.2880  ORF Transcript_1937/g.2880 Transcript_1937/m.2880 type:complete len:255 (+) Transcript_1937:41-805(+)|eukprot:CAMPEP_0204867882 /NCGR_PEP_ID=MMETSP1348-20121228/24555_1 /ASSEMBLY_ACC=CAM_ASM_000700 /TAXON_ID=215587 /ORGANISM="Aplanochytrium stocchinoi, Strain GSBS06" /LENGTH=254 /DNA_ID=CAMNT_0052020541 /DNA_START=237 /DNA_END=1001 /DNA_ORIENTATION=-
MGSRSAELDYYRWVCCRSIEEALERLQNGDKAVTYIPSSKSKEKNSPNLNVTYLAEALKTNTTCRALSVKRTVIDQKRGKVFAEMLSENSTLRHLNLGFVTDTGLMALAPGLENNCTLNSLHFPHNKISDRGAEALIVALEQNRSITTIYIGSAICDSSIFTMIETFLIRNQGGKDVSTQDIEDFDVDFLREKRLKILKSKGVGLFRRTKSKTDSISSIKAHYSITSSQASQLTDMTTDNPLYNKKKTESLKKK